METPNTYRQEDNDTGFTTEVVAESRTPIVLDMMAEPEVTLLVVEVAGECLSCGVLTHNMAGEGYCCSDSCYGRIQAEYEMGKRRANNLDEDIKKWRIEQNKRREETANHYRQKAEAQKLKQLEVIVAGLKRHFPNLDCRLAANVALDALEEAGLVLVRVSNCQSTEHNRYR